MKSLDPDLLQSLNLSERQAAVYLATMELGQDTVQAISRKSGVNRSTIYTFLDELKERQLIIETRRRGRNLYSAVHPQQLIEIGQTRLRQLTSLLPELLARYNVSRDKPRVTFYEGTKQIQDIYSDILRERKEMVGWTDYEYAKKMMGKLYDQFAEERARRNILYRTIARDTPAARERKALSNRHLREVKLTSSEGLVTEIYIYADKVVLLSFRSKPVIAVMIEDPLIATTLRSIWKNAWARL